jgi:uncharacterized membrane protein YedE/YeeE
MNVSDMLHALAGGVLIGLAATLLLWLNGRLAGISNITGGLLAFRRGDISWRVVFLASLVAGAALWYAFGGTPPIPRTAFPGGLLALGGVLVGYGTGLGNGCTSGHGVCGLGRLSLRSFVAVAVFLVVGIVTAVVVRHGLGVQ